MGVPVLLVPVGGALIILFKLDYLVNRYLNVKVISRVRVVWASHEGFRF
jgi:hypothetical protein